MEANQGKKKKRGRRAYLDNFQQSLTGEWIYTGKYVRWVAPRKATLVRLWCLSALSCLLGVVTGCISGTGMENSAFVLLPYALGLILSFVLIYHTGKLTTAGDPMRAYHYECSAPRLVGLSVVACALAGITLLCEAVSVLLSGAAFTGSMGAVALFMLLDAVNFAALLLYWRTVRALQWDRDE